MWKSLFIVLTVITLSHAQTTNTSTGVGREKYPFKYHHHHGLYYLTHYWVFLAVKAKIIFLIGTFISFWVFAGKVFAFLYYYRNKENNCKCPQYHENIGLPDEPHYQHKYSTISHAPDYFLPQRKSPYLSSYEKYSRSLKDSIFENIGVLKWIIRRTDVSDLAFDAMNLKEKCRRRFICEADLDAKKNPLRSIIFYLFSDIGIMKYKSNLTVNSLQECESLGPQCK